MKKYVSLCVVTVILLLTAAVTPNAVSSFLPRVELTGLQPSHYQSAVTAGGVVEEIAQEQVELSFPVVPDKVYKSVGDTVEQGEVLAQVDAAATQAALLNLGDGELSKQVLASLSGGEAPEMPEQIVATADGVITAMNLSEGTLCEESPAATISRSDELQAKVTVNESSISGVQEGQKVTLSGSGFPKTYTGTVTKVYPTARQQLSGTAKETVVDVLVAIDSPDEQIKPGFTVQASIKTGKERLINLLPYDAIEQDEEQNEYVYIYENGQAVRQNVTTGLETAQGVEIIAGIGPEDKIIAQASALSGDRCYVRVTG